jgi:hypothetical protein
MVLEITTASRYQHKSPVLAALVFMKWTLREWGAVSLILPHSPFALLYLGCPLWAIVYEVGIVSAVFF